MVVAVIGAGTVGAATAALLAYLGHPVRVAERHPGRRRALEQGRSPVPEPGLEALLASAAPRIQVCASAAEAARGADAVTVAVGTSFPDPQARVAAVLRALREALPDTGQGSRPLVVIRSTLPPGGTRALAALLEAAGGSAVPLVYWPEFLRQGSAAQDTLYPYRIVVGSDDPASVEALTRLIRPVLEQRFPPPPDLPPPPGYRPPPLLVVDPPTAELIKLGANALLALKAGFMAELADCCRIFGARTDQVAQGIGLDPRLGQGHLEPRLGWGGPCLSADTAALVRSARAAGLKLPLPAAALRANRLRVRRAASRLASALGGLSGREIGLWGLAFKPGTAEVRGSPALALARLLRRAGASLRAHDPALTARRGGMAFPAALRRLALLGGIRPVLHPLEAAAGADALVVATPWPEYAQVEPRRLAQVMRRPVVLDGGCLWDPEAARRAGLIYLGVDG